MEALLMKKIIAILMMLSMLCGCSFLTVSKKPETNISYTTKYVINTETLDIRNKPDNSAGIIQTLQKGNPVSFVKDCENGYSEIVYNGKTGYVLAAYLTEEQPKEIVSGKNPTPVTPQKPPVSAPQPATPKPAPPQRQAKNTSIDYSILSNRTLSEINEYITGYVQPLFKQVENNLSSYSSFSNGSITYWSDSKGYIRKKFAAGTYGINMNRYYYYDTDSGRIAFALLENNGTKYRLYFRTNQLVRYIPPSGEIYDNPDFEEALEYGTMVISEAYN